MSGGQRSEQDSLCGPMVGAVLAPLLPGSQAAAGWVQTPNPKPEADEGGGVGQEAGCWRWGDGIVSTE